MTDVTKSYDPSCAAGSITDLSQVAATQYTGAAPSPATQPVLPPVMVAAQPGEYTANAGGDPVPATPDPDQGVPEA